MPRLLLFLAFVGFCTMVLPLLLRGAQRLGGLLRALAGEAFEELLFGRARTTARRALGEQWREWFSELWSAESGGWGADRSAHYYHSAFLLSLFSMLGKLAKADGRVDEREIAAIERLMSVELNLSPRGREMAREIFRGAKTSAIPFERFAEDYARLFGRNVEVLRFMYGMLEQVALADGPLSSAERELLAAARRIFRLEPEGSTATGGANGAAALARWYDALGLKPGASLGEIKKAYRKCAMECHPDRMIARGVPPQLRARTEARFKEVQQAYEELTRTS